MNRHRQTEIDRDPHRHTRTHRNKHRYTHTHYTDTQKQQRQRHTFIHTNSCTNRRFTQRQRQSYTQTLLHRNLVTHTDAFYTQGSLYTITSLKISLQLLQSFVSFGARTAQTGDIFYFNKISTCSQSIHCIGELISYLCSELFSSNQAVQAPYRIVQVSPFVWQIQQRTQLHPQDSENIAAASFEFFIGPRKEKLRSKHRASGLEHMKVGQVENQSGFSRPALVFSATTAPLLGHQGRVIGTTHGSLATTPGKNSPQR